MIPIVVCTTGSKSLPVLEASVKAYAPDNELIVFSGPTTTFGQAYNSAMEETFKTHDEIIIANDDVVLNPYTIPFMLEDINFLKSNNMQIGYVAARSDYVRLLQNIRYNSESEHQIKEVDIISPIFSYITKSAFESAQFPPINWYSDDVMCLDLKKVGYRNFVSRAYVHHSGSMTIGRNIDKFMIEDKPWVLENRPEYINYLFGEEK